MPSKIQYDIVTQQCNAMTELCYPTRIRMSTTPNKPDPIILVDGFTKSWRFTDPDWEVVSRQLATLYITLKKRKQC